METIEDYIEVILHLPASTRRILENKWANGQIKNDMTKLALSLIDAWQLSLPV